MTKFKLPPISPLLGSRFNTYFQTLSYGKIDPKYYLKVVLTFLIILVATPLHWIDDLYFRVFIKKRKAALNPVFIIGHWRSGTTFLHNILTNDPQMAFVTTYQSVFSNNHVSKFIFRTFMKYKMPEKRPGDNVRLGVNYPQEDEFAMSNINPYTYYQFLYFPDRYIFFYNLFIRFDGPKEIKKKWIKDYQGMIEKACYSTGGQLPVLKNPCNTGRISLLLDAYPDAKFIHIVRNPITVFLSARKFFTELLPTLWFHDVNDEFIENMVFEVYEMLMGDFLRIKSQVPEKNLIEFKFEDFENDPMYFLEKIYTQFDIRNFSEVKNLFKDYIIKMSAYRKNKFEAISEELLNRILERWGFAMDLWHYDVPGYLDVIKKEAIPNL